MPSMPEPALSVIIPAYNTERFLGAAIESILRQGHPNLEILVVDDGSADRSLEIARSFPQVRGFSQAHAGPAAARNLGIQNSRAPLLAFLDADDLWPAGRLERMLEKLRAHPGLDAVAGRMQWVGEGAWREDGSPDFVAPPILTFGFPAALIRRAAFDRVGPINPDFQRGEDTEWFLRAREAGLNIHIMDEVVLYYRRHGNNLTRDATPVAGLTLQILKASLDRRRKQNSGQVASLHPLEMDPALLEKP